MKIMSVVGARPNFMKVAPIIRAIREYNDRVASANANKTAEPELIQHLLVHTGQHYDQLMSDSFFADLELPQPDAHLGVGSGSHAAQTAEVMRKFEQVILQEKPDVLIVVGDVNSTAACALVAVKISYDEAGTRPLIAHVEAGLRSFDRTMPEEINRIVTDHLSDLLFVTEESALRNLASEGIASTKVHFVGNTMIDSLMAYKKKAQLSTILDVLGLKSKCVTTNGSDYSISRYALLTLHRPANVDNRKTFLNILEGLIDLAREYLVIFPAHPRTQRCIRDLRIEDRFEWASAGTALNTTKGVRITQPVGYLDFLCLMNNASIVVTDSGGIQEETTCLGVPCVTVRENTERPITVDVGTNCLAGVHPEGIRQAIRRQLESRASTGSPEKWDGKSAARILEILRRQTLPIIPSGEVCTAIASH
jgi:UDP-N-acetylglucosamine 2-epimerase (non-hydrolysing)